ncbi:MAG: hypothetical protein H0W84_04310, partial [Bacteroidetes bacterium]|nr:hypothetical protein [Bacteroidota bacterium]
MKRNFIRKAWIIGIILMSNLNGFGQLTTLSEDYNNNIVPAPWRAGQGFFISSSDQRLKVKVGKQQWEEFSYDANFNLSAAPRVSFKIRGDFYFQFVLAFVDANGVDNRFPDPLIATIFPSKDFIDVSYDMTGLLKTVDVSKITSIRFMVDPACEKSVNIEIDDFKVGTAAAIYPRLISPITQNVYANAGLTTTVLRGITLGSTVTATSSNTGLIPNPSVAAVGTNGLANMTFTPVTNQSGTAKITLKVSKAGMTDLLFPFDIVVSANLAPTIDAVLAKTMGSNQTLFIPLAGISDGNTERVQNVTITGTSSDQTVIKDADIIEAYTNPLTHGNVTIKTQAMATGFKMVNVTLTLKDDAGITAGGVDTKTIVIPVTVYASYYKSPEIDPIASNNFAYIGTNYVVTLTGINDGNGGNQVSTITAVSSNTIAVSNPVVSYTPGNNTATISYNAKTKDIATITVTVSNTGAPANSNGNTTTAITFTVKGVDPAYTGYIEDFSSYGVNGTTPTPNVFGADYYSSGTGGDDRVSWMTNLEAYDQKWFVEGQGAEQTLTLDPANKRMTLVVDKPNSVPRTFAGVWYSPRKLFNLSGAKYLSLKISSDVATKATFDIFDVNNKRYGLLPEQNITGTPTVITFIFDKAPADASFDFSKVAAVLFNSVVFQAFKGTFTISDLKIGDLADNAPPPMPAAIMMSPIANRTILSNTVGYTVNLENVYVVKDAIELATPVTLTVSSSNTGLIPTPIITNPVNGQAAVKMKPVAGATGKSTITITAKAAGVLDKIFTFDIVVLNKSTLSPTTLTLNGNVTYQAIAGIGLEAPHSEGLADERVGNMGASMLRFDMGGEMQPGLEGLLNDNSDPFVMDLSKYKYKEETVLAFKRAIKLGCTRFIGCVWTPPIWMKGVLAHRPQTQLGTRNRLLDEFYDEFAEYIVGSALAFKDEFGIEMYSVCLENEAEFYSSGNLTATCGYTKEEAAEVVRRVYPRLRAAGLATRIHGFDQLGQQNNVLTWFSSFNNTDVKDKFDAFSIHAYGANAVTPATMDDATLQSYYTECQRVTPKKELWMTETSGWPQDASGGATAISSLFSSFANNLSAWTFLSIDMKLDVMNFYVHKNFAKFIRPGAVRIGATSGDVPGIAFKHDLDKTYTVVLINTTTSMKQSKIAGMPANFPTKMYAYMTAENINTQLIDSVSASDGYMVN